MNPAYVEFEEKYLDDLIASYMDYYNARGGTWTYEKAYRRLHQMITMEDSLVILQVEEKRLAGFLMGHFKCFDDSTGFFLEEILVFPEFQGKGYGSDFLRHLKSEVKGRGGQWIELLTTTEKMHRHFYGKNGYTQSDHLVLEYMDL